MKNLPYAINDPSDFGLGKEPDYARLGVEYDCPTGTYRDAETRQPVDRREILLRESEISYDS
jgi:hypothetical protein